MNTTLPQANICVLGAGAVGKTCLSLQFMKSEFCGCYIPTIEDVFTTRVSLKNGPCELTVIDTAGQDEFASMRWRYFRDAGAFIFVFALDDPTSVEYMMEMLDDVQSIRTDPKFVVAANKSDLPIDEQRVNVDNVLNKYPILKNKIILTSAKENRNVDELFIKAAESCLGIEEEENQQPAEDVTCNCLLI